VLGSLDEDGHARVRGQRTTALPPPCSRKNGQSSIGIWNLNLHKSMEDWHTPPRADNDRQASVKVPFPAHLKPRCDDV